MCIRWLRLEPPPLGAGSAKSMRRLDPRFDCSVPVDCTGKTLLAAHRVTNISRGGIFIHGSSLPVDTELQLQLHLDGTESPVQARARVVWNYDIVRNETARPG